MDMATVQRPMPLPILLVIDSAPLRITLRHIRQSYRDFAVIRGASDGSAALELALLAPQVVIGNVQQCSIRVTRRPRRAKALTYQERTSVPFPSRLGSTPSKNAFLKARRSLARHWPAVFQPAGHIGATNFTIVDIGS